MEPDAVVVSRKLAYFALSSDARAPVTAADVTYYEVFAASGGAKPPSEAGAKAWGGVYIQGSLGSLGMGGGSMLGDGEPAPVPLRGDATFCALHGVSDLFHEVIVPSVVAEGDRLAVARPGAGVPTAVDEGALQVLTRSASRYSVLLHEVTRSMGSVTALQLDTLSPDLGEAGAGGRGGVV